MACVFCEIVAGSAPAHIVDEDRHTVSFLDIFPFTHGHALVVPRRHVDDLWGLDEAESAQVMAAARRVAEKMRGALEPDGINLLHATGAEAFQTVFHMHLHVIPRYRADTMTLPPWPKAAADPGVLEALAARIRTGGAAQ